MAPMPAAPTRRFLPILRFSEQPHFDQPDEHGKEDQQPAYQRGVLPVVQKNRTSHRKPGYQQRKIANWTAWWPRPSHDGGAEKYKEKNELKPSA
jgi:hypothetical protein